MGEQDYAAPSLAHYAQANGPQPAGVAIGRGTKGEWDVQAQRPPLLVRVTDSTAQANKRLSMLFESLLSKHHELFGPMVTGSLAAGVASDRVARPETVESQLEGLLQSNLDLLNQIEGVAASLTGRL